MSIKLGINAYGKNAVNLSKIFRHEGYHEIRQISVNVRLAGDFESAHTRGDNSNILPTDTQKNTVYALAQSHFKASIEEFALVLSGHFIKNNPQAISTTVEITEHLWHRMFFEEAHPHAFTGGGSEKRYTSVTQKNTGNTTIVSGIKDLLILKTTDSEFKGFLKDEFTVLKETDDRILSTQCEATWTYEGGPVDFNGAFKRIRSGLLKIFAFHKSLSVQHTLYAMGEGVLEENEQVKDISLIMPNKHHIPFNLEQFEIANQNEIFIATDEPYGYITATIERSTDHG